MNKKQLIEQMVEHTDSPKSEAEKHLEAFTTTITDALKGGRGGPDSGLWEILRPRSEGQRRQESAERGEDEDPSLQGSGVQGGQISQGFDLVVSWTTGFPSRLRPGNFLMHRSACKDDSANFRCRGFSEVRPLAHR